MVGRVTSVDPGVIVRAHLDSFSAGDLVRMLATLAPDAFFLSGTTVVEPHDFPDFFGWAMRELDPRMELVSLVVEGEQVAGEFIESVTVDGQRQHLHRAAFYRVVDGLITSATVYDQRD